MARTAKKETVLTPEEKLAQVLVPEEEQPYQVPNNWIYVYQKTICKLSNGEKKENQSLPYLEVKYLRGNKEAETVELGNYIIAGTKVILVDGENSGEVFTVFEDGYMGSTFKALDISPVVDPDYLRLYISTKRDLYRNNKKGSAIPHLNKELFFSMPFPFAPIKEQIRVVNRIESLFAKLDEAKEKVQAVVDCFEDRRTMILHKAFTGELTKMWRDRHEFEARGWIVTQLKECSTEIGDGLHGTPVYDDNGQYWFVNGNNLSGLKIELKTDTKKVNRSEYEKYRIELFPEKTVLLSINGTLGRTAFYNGEQIILGKSACYINTNDRLNKCFLRYYFMSKEFIDYANSSATGSTIKNLGLKAMRNMTINLPSIDEQSEIVRILDSIFLVENQAKETAEQVIDQIDTMKKSILARAFRGELGTNDPTDESAEELLKRVL